MATIEIDSKDLAHLVRFAVNEKHKDIQMFLKLFLHRFKRKSPELSPELSVEISDMLAQLGTLSLRASGTTAAPEDFPSEKHEGRLFSDEEIEKFQQDVERVEAAKLKKDILALIEKEPGMYSSDVAERLDIGYGLAYKLTGQLLAEGHLR